MNEPQISVEGERVVYSFIIFFIQVVFWPVYWFYVNYDYYSNTWEFLFVSLLIFLLFSVNVLLVWAFLTTFIIESDCDN